MVKSICSSGFPLSLPAVKLACIKFHGAPVPRIFPSALSPALIPCSITPRESNPSCRYTKPVLIAAFERSTDTSTIREQLSHERWFLSLRTPGLNAFVHGRRGKRIGVVRFARELTRTICLPCWNGTLYLLVAKNRPSNV